MGNRVDEKMKQRVLQEAAGMRMANKVAQVSGKRFDIPAPGRTIHVVYYETEKKHAPLILGFHGGGYLFGGNAMNDAMWRAVSEKLDMNVASIEYRKSPEFRYQEALDDAYDALCYFQEHDAEYGYDVEHIGVMGCSAGANLAATLCIYAEQRKNQGIERQILMYPFLDAYTDPDSKGNGSLEGPIMYLFNELHCTPEEAKLPIVSPIFAKREELVNMPEAIFCMADNDALKGEGYQYAEMLGDAGVKTFVMESAGMPHGYFESGFGKISDEEMTFLGEEVQQMVRSGEIARASEEALLFIRECILGE